MSKLVSIVIPIYNAEKYLNKTLDSIANQNYDNFEVIMVNDGSKDSSEDICNEYAKKDNRFKYFYKDNSGVSDTRNYGIDKSKGDYLCFIDADDIINYNFLTQFIDTIDMTNSELCCCIFQKFIDDELITLDEKYDDDNYTVYSGKNKYDILINKTLGYVINKMFVADIIKKNKIKFNKDIKMAEDMVFCFDYLRHANKVTLIENCNYKYRIIMDSASRNLSSVGWFDIFKSYGYLYDNKELCSDKYNNKLIYSCFYYIYLAKYRLKYISDKETSKRIKKIIIENYEKIKSNYNKLTIKQKLKINGYKYLNSIMFKIKLKKNNSLK